MLPSSKSQLKYPFKQFILFNLTFLTLQLIIFCGTAFGFVYALEIPASVYLFDIVETFIQIILYILLSGLQTFWFWGIQNHLKSSSVYTQNKIHFLIFLISTIFLLSINSYYFPLSRFSHIYHYEANPEIALCLSVVSGVILLGLTLNALNYLKYRKMVGLIFSIIVVTFLYAPYTHQNNTTPLTSTRYPNIIIIGVDSLNPTQVNDLNTPILNQFINQSVRFENTISPLARTYSAWVSILTGLYPIHHHARENLMPSALVRNEASIVWPLRALGYQTIFASDDRRFNNLDESFGFKTIIGPKLGVNDILLGNFYDFPLTNLLVNLKISQWIFPYNYMNRAGEFTYLPHTFDHEIKQAIDQANPKNAPLFFAIHFTLPHWPYSWAESAPSSRIDDQLSVTQKNELYQIAIKRVDQQIASLMNELKQQHLLSDSLVIFLSDHGEALYHKGSRVTSLDHYQGKKPSPLAHYFKHYTSTTLNKSAGHGSDLLSLEQFHCLLGFQIYQQDRLKNLNQNISTRVALIDIAPTIYAYISQFVDMNKRHFDGLSLLPTILKRQNSILPERAFMLESGLLPNQFLTLKEAIYYARLYYAVNPENERLELRTEQLNKIHATKLYGIIDKNWLLVLYPKKMGYLPVLVELNSQKWTDQLDSDFAKNSPVTSLMQQLTTFYPNKLRHHQL